jgi:hypothetical protein
MKYKIIHLFVKLTNLFQSKIVTTKVSKKIIFLFFIIAVIAMQLRTFTRFHWIIHDHVIHELYCQKDKTYIFVSLVLFNKKSILKVVLRLEVVHFSVYLT